MPRTRGKKPSRLGQQLRKALPPSIRYSQKLLPLKVLRKRRAGQQKARIRMIGVILRNLKDSRAQGRVLKNLIGNVKILGRNGPLENDVRDYVQYRSAQQINDQVEKLKKQQRTENYRDWWKLGDRNMGMMVMVGDEIALWKEKMGQDPEAIEVPDSDSAAEFYARWIHNLLWQAQPVYKFWGLLLKRDIQHGQFPEQESIQYKFSSLKKMLYSSEGIQNQMAQTIEADRVQIIRNAFSDFNTIGNLKGFYQQLVIKGRAQITIVYPQDEKKSFIPLGDHNQQQKVSVANSKPWVFSPDFKLSLHLLTPKQSEKLYEIHKTLLRNLQKQLQVFEVTLASFPDLKKPNLPWQKDPGEQSEELPEQSILEEPPRQPKPLKKAKLQIPDSITQFHQRLYDQRRSKFIQLRMARDRLIIHQALVASLKSSNLTQSYDREFQVALDPRPLRIMPQDPEEPRNVTIIPYGQQEKVQWFLSRQSIDGWGHQVHRDQHMQLVCDFQDCPIEVPMTNSNPDKNHFIKVLQVTEDLETVPALIFPKLLATKNNLRQRINFLYPFATIAQLPMLAGDVFIEPLKTKNPFLEQFCQIPNFYEKNFDHVPFRIIKTKDRGYGVETMVGLNAKTIIGAYVGVGYLQSQLPVVRIDSSLVYGYYGGQQIILYPWNVMNHTRFLNTDGAKSNCVTQSAMTSRGIIHVMKTKKFIKAGEQLTWDYGKQFDFNIDHTVQNTILKIVRQNQEPQTPIFALQGLETPVQQYRPNIVRSFQEESQGIKPRKIKDYSQLRVQPVSPIQIPRQPQPSIPQQESIQQQDRRSLFRIIQRPPTNPEQSSWVQPQFPRRPLLFPNPSPVSVPPVPLPPWSLPPVRPPKKQNPRFQDQQNDQEIRIVFPDLTPTPPPIQMVHNQIDSSQAYIFQSQRLLNQPLNNQEPDLFLQSSVKEQIRNQDLNEYENAVRQVEAQLKMLYHRIVDYEYEINHTSYSIPEFLKRLQTTSAPDQNKWIQQIQHAFVLRKRHILERFDEQDKKQIQGVLKRYTGYLTDLVLGKKYKWDATHQFIPWYQIIDQQMINTRVNRRILKNKLDKMRQHQAQHHQPEEPEELDDEPLDDEPLDEPLDKPMVNQPQDDEPVDRPMDKQSLDDEPLDEEKFGDGGVEGPRDQSLDEQIYNPFVQWLQKSTPQGGFVVETAQDQVLFDRFTMEFLYGLAQNQRNQMTYRITTDQSSPVTQKQQMQFIRWVCCSQFDGKSIWGGIPSQCLFRSIPRINKKVLQYKKCIKMTMIKELFAVLEITSERTYFQPVKFDPSLGQSFKQILKPTVRQIKNLGINLAEQMYELQQDSQFISEVQLDEMQFVSKSAERLHDPHSSQPEFPQMSKSVELGVPYPYAKVAYLLFLQLLYRQIQCLRTINWLDRNNLNADHARTQQFKRQLRETHMRLVYTPELRIYSPVRRVIHKNYPAEIQISYDWQQIWGYGFPRAGQKVWYISLMEFANTMRQLSIPLGNQIMNDMNKTWQQYEEHQIGVSNNWQIFSVVGYWNPGLSTQMLSKSQVYNKLIATQGGSRKIRPWSVFQPHQYQKFQNQQFKKWSLLKHAQTAPGNPMGLCIHRCLEYLTIKTVDPLKIPYALKQQFVDLCLHGKTAEFLDIMLRTYDMGHVYEGQVGNIRKGRYQLSFYVAYKHITLIDTQCKLTNPQLGAWDNVLTAHMDKFAEHQHISKLKQQLEDYPQLKDFNKYKLDRHQRNLKSGVRLSTKCYPPQQPIDLALRARTCYVDLQCLAVEQFVQSCYHYSAIVYEGDQGLYQSIWSNFDVKTYRAHIAFVNRLKQCVQRNTYTAQKPFTVWGFNSMKYQMAYFLPQITKQFGSVKVHGTPSEPKAYSVLEESVFFRDFRMYHSQGTLRTLCQSYKTPVQKMALQELDITTIKSGRDALQHRELIQKYCLADCASLMYLTLAFFNSMVKVSAKVYEDFQTQLQDDWKLKIHFKQVMSSLTLPSLAMTIFTRIFLGRPIKNTQPDHWAKIQRQAYYGGLCAVYKHIVNQKVQCYDINSSYPASMTRKQPWMWVRELTPSELQKYSADTLECPNLAFFEVHSFELPDQVLPFIPVRTKHGLVYPKSHIVCQQQSVAVWGFQINKLRDLKLKLKRGCLYTSGGNNQLKSYVDVFYKLKTQLKDPIHVLAVKLLLNSLYGKFGQRPISQVMIYDEQYFNHVIDQLQTFTLLSHESNGQVCTKSVQTIEGKGIWVRIAAAITARSRTLLVDAVQICGIKNLYYIDTDSITINTRGGHRMVLNDLVDDKKLGGWKIEACFNDGIFIAPKHAFLRLDDSNTKKVLDKGIEMIKNQKWMIKWKGIPKKLLIPQKLKSFYVTALRLFDRFDLTPQDVHPLTRFDIDYFMTSQRWTRTAQGVRIENFFRKTGVIFKRQYIGHGQTRALKL